MICTKSVLIFGVGQFQQSLIERCKLNGLFTVGIDPNPNADCKENVDEFFVVPGDDLEKTIWVAQKYRISGVITAATDKPLVMMARVAEKLDLPFFSIETAQVSTDKLLMKQKFQKEGLPCAKGYIVNSKRDLFDLNLTFPVIVKPRDNSGSRGVIYAGDMESALNAFDDALKYTKKGNVLVEEYIEGKEYSIESIHYKDKHQVIQFTEKTTTDFPYNVEIAHIQPADISLRQQEKIRKLITQIAHILGFENCMSHTEIKINSRGIYIIETSPRLGGDFISSKLVPLSTGFNMEDALIDISTKSYTTDNTIKNNLLLNSGILFFQLPLGTVTKIGEVEKIREIEGFHSYKLNLREGQKIPYIKNSVDRYGYSIFQTRGKKDLSKSMAMCKKIIAREVSVG